MLFVELLRRLIVLDAIRAVPILEPCYVNVIIDNEFKIKLFDVLGYSGNCSSIIIGIDW